MKLAAKTWVLVVDGARGLVLVNEGTAAEPRLETHKTYHLDNSATHEQGRDRPGRVHESTGARRSATETPDLHQRAEDRFVEGILAELAREAAAGAFKKLVIVAPPIALGKARKSLDPKLAALVVEEIAADYTKMAVPEITAAVVKAMEG